MEETTQTPNKPGAPGAIPLEDRLRQLREASGLSQQQLADRMNVTRQTISGWERGRSQPDIGSVQLLAGYYDLTVDELLKGVEKKVVKRTGWRWLFFAAALLFAFLLLFEGMTWLHMAAGVASVGIIGGADGPTAIFITTSAGMYAIGIWSQVNLVLALLFVFLAMQWAPVRQPRRFAVMGIILLASAALRPLVFFTVGWAMQGTLDASLVFSTLNTLLAPGFWAAVLAGIYCLQQAAKRKKSTPPAQG